MSETKTEPVNAWTGIIGASDSSPAAGGPQRVITTVETESCPVCGSPVKSLSRNDRCCCACGFVFTVFTPGDELDTKADREVRSREFSVERGRGRKIAPGASRW